MCTEKQVETITKAVASVAKETLKEKLVSVILYGSYARGDFDDESDIDVLIIADIPMEECWSYNCQLTEKIVDLELENDVVISTQVIQKDNFNQYQDALPFYRSIQNEGISIPF